MSTNGTGIDASAGLGDMTLAVAAQNGDQEAFGHLYRKYAPMVHGVLLARVRPVDIDDLVQDVFVAALKRIRGLRDARAFGAWLAAIARNVAHDHYRRARTSPTEVELPDDLPAHEPGDSEALAVLHTIRALPDAYRETLILRLVEGMTGAEIAERTGLTAGSVRVNLHRGMTLLRERLGWTDR